MISFIHNYVRERQARARLQQWVDQSRASFATQDYAKRREAALKSRPLREHRLKCGHGFVGEEG